MTAAETAAEDLIDLLAGEWSGIARTWLEPDSISDESPVNGRIHRIGQTRFLLHEYEGSYDGQPRQGVEILGVKLDPGGRYSVAWVDSFHMSTDIMLSNGAPAADPRGFSVLGSFADPQSPDSPRWGWRTDLNLPDRDHLTMTAYISTPEGEEARATEVTYTRVA